MPARKPARPAMRARLAASQVNAPDGVGRAIGEVADAVRRVEAQVRDRASHNVDLIVGENTIAHGLGRKPRGVSVTPTVASASFAWAMTSADTQVAVIEVLGEAQPGAEVEFR